MKKISYFLSIILSGIVLSLPVLHSAGSVYGLPAPDILLKPACNKNVPFLKGMCFDPDAPLSMRFIMDKGGDRYTPPENEIERLISYFMAGLTMPSDDLWVNLSPYEQDRIMPDYTSRTQLGKDMLCQDYMLKLLSSSLTHPDTSLGRAYWEALNPESQILNPVTEAGLSRIWLKPGKSVLYESSNAALITESTISVETDGANAALIPAIEQQVNEGSHFSSLRQIYHSLILSVWFKQRFFDSYYASYIDQSKIKGIDLDDKKIKENIWKLYCRSFNRGVYDQIRREKNGTGKKRFFSGGVYTPKVTDIKVIKADSGNRETIEKSFSSSAVSVAVTVGEVFADNNERVFGGRKDSRVISKADELIEVADVKEIFLNEFRIYQNDLEAICHTVSKLESERIFIANLSVLINALRDSEIKLVNGIEHSYKLWRELSDKGMDLRKDYLDYSERVYSYDVLFNILKEKAVAAGFADGSGTRNKGKYFSAVMTALGINSNQTQVELGRKLTAENIRLTQKVTDWLRGSINGNYSILYQADRGFEKIDEVYGASKLEVNDGGYRFELITIAGAKPFICARVWNLKGEDCGYFVWYYKNAQPYLRISTHNYRAGTLPDKSLFMTMYGSIEQISRNKYKSDYTKARFDSAHCFALETLFHDSYNGDYYEAIDTVAEKLKKILPQGTVSLRLLSALLMNIAPANQDLYTSYKIVKGLSQRGIDLKYRAAALLDKSNNKLYVFEKILDLIKPYAGELNIKPGTLQYILVYMGFDFYFVEFNHRLYKFWSERIDLEMEFFQALNMTGGDEKRAVEMLSEKVAPMKDYGFVIKQKLSFYVKNVLINMGILNRYARDMLYDASRRLYSAESAGTGNVLSDSNDFSTTQSDVYRLLQKGILTEPEVIFIQELIKGESLRDAAVLADVRNADLEPFCVGVGTKLMQHGVVAFTSDIAVRISSALNDRQVNAERVVADFNKLVDQGVPLTIAFTRLVSRYRYDGQMNVFSPEELAHIIRGSGCQAKLIGQYNANLKEVRAYSDRLSETGYRLARDLREKAYKANYGNITAKENDTLVLSRAMNVQDKNFSLYVKIPLDNSKDIPDRVSVYYKTKSQVYGSLDELFSVDMAELASVRGDLCAFIEKKSFDLIFGEKFMAHNISAIREFDEVSKLKDDRPFWKVMADMLYEWNRQYPDAYFTFDELTDVLAFHNYQGMKEITAARSVAGYVPLAGQEISDMYYFFLARSGTTEGAFRLTLNRLRRLKPGILPDELYIYLRQRIGKKEDLAANYYYRLENVSAELGPEGTRRFSFIRDLRENNWKRCMRESLDGFDGYAVMQKAYVSDGRTTKVYCGFNESAAVAGDDRNMIKVVMQDEKHLYQYEIVAEFTYDRFLSLGYDFDNFADFFEDESKFVFNKNMSHINDSLKEKKQPARKGKPRAERRGRSEPVKESARDEAAQIPQAEKRNTARRNKADQKAYIKPDELRSTARDILHTHLNNGMNRHSAFTRTMNDIRRKELPAVTPLILFRLLDDQKLVPRSLVYKYLEFMNVAVLNSREKESFLWRVVRDIREKGFVQSKRAFTELPGYDVLNTTISVEGSRFCVYAGIIQGKEAEGKPAVKIAARKILSGKSTVVLKTFSEVELEELYKTRDLAEYIETDFRSVLFERFVEKQIEKRSRQLETKQNKEDRAAARKRQEMKRKILKLAEQKKKERAQRELLEKRRQRLANEAKAKVVPRRFQPQRGVDEDGSYYDGDYSLRTYDLNDFGDIIGSSSVGKAVGGIDMTSGAFDLQLKTKRLPAGVSSSVSGSYGIKSGLTFSISSVAVISAEEIISYLIH